MAMKKYGADIQIVGIRKTEGGIRALAYKSCMSHTSRGLSHFPTFWYTNGDKVLFEDAYGITHSDAYEVYGFKRTGCAGCPFNSRFDSELEILREYESGLANGVEHIFNPSYEYTRQYYAFRDEMKKKAKAEKAEGR